MSDTDGTFEDDTAPKGGPGAPGPAGAGDGGEDAPGDAAGRRLARYRAAQAAARRVLSAPKPTLREALAALAEGAPGSYRMDTPVDHYGDGVVAALEERVAALLGMPAAAFFPSGTMAQQVALRCWAGRTGNPVVALHPLAHPVVHERGALTALTGLRTVHPVTARRMPSAAEIAAFDEPFGTLMLELPLREAGFVLPAWQELVDVVAAARERDAVVHLDGARLWECGPHFGRTLPEIAELADSVYVSFYKSLGGISGAALAGPEDFVAEARAWRHRYGGQIYQQWPAALAALTGLRTVLPRLPEYVAHARTVAAAMAEELAPLPLAGPYPRVPHTHQFQVWLPYPAEAVAEAVVAQAEEDGVVLFSPWWVEPGRPGHAATEVTVAAAALEWSARDVRAAVRGLLRRLGAPAG